MQILTSRFNRQPFDQEGLTKDCNIIGRVIKRQEETMKKHMKKRTAKEKTNNPSNQPQK